MAKPKHQAKIVATIRWVYADGNPTTHLWAILFGEKSGMKVEINEHLIESEVYGARTIKELYDLTPQYQEKISKEAENWAKEKGLDLELTLSAGLPWVEIGIDMVVIKNQK
jgi:hypothetical protein